MTKNKISKYFLFISIFTFIAIFFFIVQQSYNKLMTPINLAKNSDLIKPINPNLDIETLNLVETRQKYTLPPSP